MERSREAEPHAVDNEVEQPLMVFLADRERTLGELHAWASNVSGKITSQVPAGTEVAITTSPPVLPNSSVNHFSVLCPKALSQETKSAGT